MIETGLWTTKNEVMKISDMTTEHIEKCIDMLLYFMDTTNDLTKRSGYVSKITELENELNSRKNVEAVDDQTN